jgi:hypothetical protein
VRSTLDELTKELEELGTLIASISPVNAALSGNQDSLVRQYILVRRRFDYAAFAVALYASFEKFIEGLVAAYAQLESRRLQYTELPPKLVKKHLSQTAEMLSRGRIGEGRYVGLTELEVVKNLFECLSGVKPYRLNETAVVAHDLNLRVNEINALFAAVGVEQMCERIRQADALVEWYRNVNSLTADPQDVVPAMTIEERIKDLVERRNQIAHQGGTPDNIPGVDKMGEAVGFILAFSRSVFAMTVGQYLGDHHAATGIQLVQRRNPYQDGKVVIVDASSHRLFRGQPVFALAEATGARWGRIQELRLNDVAVDAFDPNTVAANGIGIELDFKCPRDTNLVALPDDDDMVWSPLEPVAAPITSTY